MEKNSKIYVAGHRGLVGSAIVRKLEKEGYKNLLTVTSDELDLRFQAPVHDFFKKHHPEYVFLAAAKVGGILANNTYRAEFIYDNLMIQNNVIHASFLSGVIKLLFLGSSCVYPRLIPQPIKESYLLQGALEPTNQPYAIAKIAGLEMCNAYRSQYDCNFISVMPTNLYGPGDNYDLNNSHVLPALLRKFHEAKIKNLPDVTLWGTGHPRREFLHVDDLADACFFLMQHYDKPELVNIGTGKDLTIRGLALLIKEIVGYRGKLVFDHSKPDGTPRKLLDISKIKNMGWNAQINLKTGIMDAYEDFKGKRFITN